MTRVDGCPAHQVVRLIARLLALVVLVGGTPMAARAQDAHFSMPVPELERMLATEPIKIVTAQISRPKARGDITLKAEVAFGDRQPMRVKVRKSLPGAESFNNVPRYDIAAYELQKLLMDPAEYVVPPTALRMIPAAELRPYSPDVQPTFEGSDDLLVVVQYWLQNIKVVEDVLDPAKFESDAVYARHVGQLNVFTNLIAHRDSNVGNFLISAEGPGARVFSVDNGVAFGAPEADRGKLWEPIRVNRLPEDVVKRLRAITRDELTRRLAVVSQWRLEGGHYVAEPLGANLGQYRGVRLKDGVVQMGLSANEIGNVWRRLRRLLDSIDEGEISTF